MTAVVDTMSSSGAKPRPEVASAPDGNVPAVSDPADGGSSRPNLATLARLRGGGRSPLLSPTSRRARRTSTCTGQPPR